MSCSNLYRSLAQHTRQGGSSQPPPEGSTLAGPLPSRGPRHFGRAQGTRGSVSAARPNIQDGGAPPPLEPRATYAQEQDAIVKGAALRKKIHPSLSGEGFERSLQTRQGGLDVGLPHRADAQAEPAVLVDRPEGLEGNRRESGGLQQVAPHLLVGLKELALGRPPPEGMEARGQVDRSLGGHALDGQAEHFQGLKAAVQLGETRLDPVPELAAPLVQPPHVVQQADGGHLLGPWGPGPMCPRMADMRAITSVGPTAKPTRRP